MNEQVPDNIGSGTENTPPPFPPTARVAVAGTQKSVIPEMKRPKNGIFATFGEDFRPVEKPPSVLGVTDLLLKAPGRIAHEIIHGRSTRTTVILLVITLGCMLATGLVMGSFSGGEQLWIVPVKLTAGMLLSALICLPSLYIFTSLSGGSQSVGQTTGLFLQAVALIAILLVGFAPIVWIFSQATSTVVFMGILHMCFWLIAIWFSLQLLNTAFKHLNSRGGAVLKVWGIIFLMVILQMSTTLRPLIGPSDGFHLQGKKFFLSHWGDCIAECSRW